MSHALRQAFVRLSPSFQVVARIAIVAALVPACASDPSLLQTASDPLCADDRLVIDDSLHVAAAYFMTRDDAAVVWDPLEASDPAGPGHPTYHAYNGCVVASCDEGFGNLGQHDESQFAIQYNVQVPDGCEVDIAGAGPTALDLSVGPGDLAGDRHRSVGEHRTTYEGVGTTTMRFPVTELRTGSFLGDDVVPFRYDISLRHDMGVLYDLRVSLAGGSQTLSPGLGCEARQWRNVKNDNTKPTDEDGTYGYHDDDRSETVRGVIVETPDVDDRPTELIVEVEFAGGQDPSDGGVFHLGIEPAPHVSVASVPTTLYCASSL